MRELCCIYRGADVAPIRLYLELQNYGAVFSRRMGRVDFRNILYEGKPTYLVCDRSNADKQISHNEYQDVLQTLDKMVSENTQHQWKMWLQ